MALTQEQINIDNALKQVGADIKLRYPFLENAGALAAYNGVLTQLPIQNGGAFTYYPNSTKQSNGVTVLDAVGKGSGRWIMDSINRLDIQKFGVKAGLGVTAAVISANTNALQSAFSSGELLYVPRGGVTLDGTITVTDTPFDLLGSVRHGFFRQKADVNTLVLDNSAGIYAPSICGVRFESDVVMNSGAALTITGFPSQVGAGAYLYQKPMGNFQQIEIVGSDFANTANPTKQFKTGIVVNTPNMITFRDILINGSQRANSTGTVGIRLNAPRASVESVFDNIRIVDYNDGLIGSSGQTPGLEGLQITNSKFISVDRGITLSSDTYQAPLHVIDNCHIAAYEWCVSITNLSQGRITNGLFYNFGNNIANNFQYMIYLKQVSGYVVDNVQMYYQPVGFSNDPYGLVIASFGSNSNNLNRITNCSAVLKDGTDKPAFWLQGVCLDTTVNNVTRVGGLETLRDDNAGSSGTVIGIVNPPDPTDGETTIAAVNGVLNCKRLRPGVTAIITNPAGTVINSITGVKRGAQIRLVHNAGGLIFQHNAGLIMAEFRNATAQPGQIYTFVQQNAAETHEVSRVLYSVNYVQGTSAQTRSTNITNPNADLPSGFYTVSGSASMPTLGTYYLTVNRHNNGSGDSGHYRWDQASELGSDLTYERKGEAGVFQAWNRLISEKGFVSVVKNAAYLFVSEDVVLAAGNITITLPSTAVNNKPRIVKNIGNGTVTVAAGNGQTINGAIASVNLAPNDPARFIPNGNSWYTI